ncbi:MAG: DNA cytosine methyltransferase [Clostridiales bacterium]|jgi:DNA (cytosine-5)-methyltransferase 3A|nr:DNA cytosine methyltransferase [Clostridiales bacterium]
MIKLLIGGSPCTHWSIAQSKDRETEPKGKGWELFRNYLIAKEKYRPDYFLYENNKSAAQPIKDQISKELGVPLQYINSALVSAQNRQRFYAHNIPGVPQPEDRGILLRDILESGECWREKSYTLDANYYKTAGVYNPQKQHSYSRLMAAEPVRIGTIENDAQNPGHDSKQYRVYSPDGKSTTLCGEGGGVGAKTGLYACPAIYQTAHGFNAGGIKYDKSPTLTAVGDWAHNNFVIERADGKSRPVYEVQDGLIAIKGKQYPIKLADGFYIIRKLTVTECKRLQTVPDDYIMPCSASQNYKMLGNGWTVDVIAHILSYIPGIRDEEIEVLSMYDGMSCGRIALNKLGANVVRYCATEIDKYAIQTTMANFPDTVQLGDAFGVRADGWAR